LFVSVSTGQRLDSRLCEVTYAAGSAHARVYARRTARGRRDHRRADRHAAAVAEPGAHPGEAYRDYPYNWNPTLPRSATTLKLSNHYQEIYNVNPGFTGDPSPPGIDVFREGHHLTPWWAYYLMQYRFVTDARVIGCTFGGDAPWQHWPYRFYMDSALPAPLKDINFLREYPTYIYRGASDHDDIRMNAYNCGQIAGDSPSDPKFGGRTGAFFPHANTKKPAPLFHCPLLVDHTPESTIISGTERYMAAHAGMRSIRRRGSLPMTLAAEGGRDGHFVAQTVGWTDGSAHYYQQPYDNNVYYINYRGELNTGPLSVSRKSAY
jgi:hypothetical protein